MISVSIESSVGEALVKFSVAVKMTQEKCEYNCCYWQPLLTATVAIGNRRFAMKLLDKKRIKVKKGELLALNERNMLAKVK